MINIGLLPEKEVKRSPLDLIEQAEDTETVHD